MIVVVDELGGASEGFERAFTRESVPFATFIPEDFRDWMDSLDYGELAAIEAFLLGPGRDSAGLPSLIRRKSAAPVIALMERRRIEQTLIMFAAGVDDVVEQPVDARELFARIGAIRRRSKNANRQPHAPLRAQSVAGQVSAMRYPLGHGSAGSSRRVFRPFSQARAVIGRNDRTSIADLWARNLVT